MKRMQFRPSSQIRLILGVSLCLVFLAVSLSYADSTEERIKNARKRAFLKDFEGAIEAYDSVLEGEPQNLDALNGKARVLSWMKKYEDAETIYLKVLSVAPEHIEPLTGLADIYAWQGDYDKSIHLLEGVLNEFPDEREILLRLARYHLWAGRKGESLYYTDRVLAGHSSDRDALEIRSKALEIHKFEHFAGYYYLNINNNVDGHNLYYGLKYKLDKVYILYGRFDYLDRFSETEGKFLGGGSARLSGNLTVSAELSLAPGASVFPIVAGRVELAYLTKPSLVLYGALNHSHYKSADLYGISATGEFYVTGQLAILSRISLMRTELGGAKSSTDGALLVKATHFISNTNGIYAYFSYGNEAFLIKTIDEIGAIEARTYGIGTTYFVTSSTGLSPRIEYQDRERGTKYFQIGLEFDYRW